ncbi:DNA primase/helicase, phage-associated [Methanococcoides methylutens MM1]|uniref:DNA primase/helicase, phage-associated n=2 Tax=Methanococcoides methylutens TaxID=2226 RepID=A0A0E3SPK3_METMT|nr:DNA primase/helicase, phage-associated [Methanococcoides methylutens MM1]
MENNPHEIFKEMITFPIYKPIDDLNEAHVGFLKVYTAGNEIKCMCCHLENDSDDGEDSNIFTFPNGDLNLYEVDITEMVINAYNLNKIYASLLLNKCFDEIKNSGWYKPKISLEDCYEINEISGKVQLHELNISKYISQKYNILSYSDMLYVYDDGVFKQDTTAVLNEIQTIIEEVNYRGFPGTAAKNILFHLKYTKPETEYPFNRTDNVISVKNGVIHVNFETGEIQLKEHSPTYKFTYQLPVCYDPCVDISYIDDLMTGYVDNDHVILYQIPAQAILQMMGCNPFKESYLLDGEAHAGKSTYLELLTRVFGRDNISGVSLQAVCNDKYAPANMENKLLNMYDDLSEIPLKESGTFKKFTGSYLHTVERKHIQPYDTMIKAVHVFTCNKPPKVDEAITCDTAFWERWEYINFTNVFDVNPNFHNEIFTDDNLSAFFKVVLDKALEIRRNGLLVDSDASEVRDKWENNSEPLYQFIVENMEKSSESTEFKKIPLHDAYLDYCSKNNIDQKKIINTIETFSQRLFAYDFVATKITENRKQIPVYRGNYKFKSESEYPKNYPIFVERKGTLA